MSITSQPRFIQIALAVVVFAFGLLVWPTAYRYDHMKVGELNLPLRIARLTGKTEILYPSGWRPVSAEQPEATPQHIPADQISKLIGQAQITNYGWIEVELYNGSSWKLSEVTVLVNVFNPAKTGPQSSPSSSGTDTDPYAPFQAVISRSYRLIPEPYSDATPQSNTKFHGSLGFELAAGQTWTYSITDATGKAE